MLTNLIPTFEGLRSELCQINPQLLVPLPKLQHAQTGVHCLQGYVRLEQSDAQTTLVHREGCHIHHTRYVPAKNLRNNSSEWLYKQLLS